MFRFSDDECRRMWGDKFTFFWYNEAEIFRWGEAEFDAKAKALADAGITYAMTFSSTHFRMTYLPWHDAILRALTRLCCACHRHGIRVVEHCSGSLTYLPQNEEEWERFRGYFRGHNSSMKWADELRAYLERPGRNWGGVPIESLWQVDGRTGKPAETGYLGRAFCYNNPDYRRLYLAYLGELKKTGIDCMLADDIQYFGAGNACTCVHCRERFRRETGLELPPPERWGEFFGHYDDPAFVEWLRFRGRSTCDWQVALTAEYRRLGLETHRPNYRSTLLFGDPTANTFTACLGEWAHLFQENQFSHIIRYSWPVWFCEAALLYSFGERTNAPSMSLCYPDRFDQYYLSWALATSWGQLPFLCPEGTNLETDEDRRFNAFANAHPDLFRHPRKCADVAFLVSRESLDYAPNSLVASSHPLRGVMQAAYFSHLGVDAISEDETPEAFAVRPCIIAVGITRVSPELAGKLRHHLRQGGRLLIFGDFAVHGTTPGRDEILADPGTCRLCPSFEPQFFQCNAIQPRMYAGATPPAATAPPYHVLRLRREYGELLLKHLPQPPQIAECPDEYLATLFAPDGEPTRRILHLLHWDGLLAEGGAAVTHHDPIPHFREGDAPNSQSFTVRLRDTGFTQAHLYTPERPDECVAVELHSDVDGTALTIPAGAFAGFATIALA